MRTDTSAALYTVARAYCEARPLKVDELLEEHPPRYRWGGIVNKYDDERRTYVVTVEVIATGALRVDVLAHLTRLSLHLQQAGRDIGATLQPGGGYIQTTNTGARLTFA